MLQKVDYKDSSLTYVNMEPSPKLQWCRARDLRLYSLVSRQLHVQS